MFVVNEDKSIYVTRGDAITFALTATEDGEACVFLPGDVVRFKVYEKKDCGCVVIQKDFSVHSETGEVTIVLGKEDTKIGDLINKPADYWYEIELNPDTRPQTIIGYDDEGAKLFRLFPEGGDAA